jgi:hypothetical protein
MKVILDDNAARVVRERALKEMRELLRESNKVTDIIT